MNAVSVLFFLSGAVALVYEVLWSRYLGTFLGSAAHANAIVLATFLGGLALGNALLGRWVDRMRNPLAFYGWLEVGIGLFAALSPRLLDVLAQAFVALGQQAAMSPAGLGALRLGFAIAALLVPTVLMGGSLPALTRYFTGSMGALRSRIAWLYFINSLGAFAGTTAAGFWLVPAFGLDAAMAAAAMLNVAVGLGAVALSKSLQPVAVEAEAAIPEPTEQYGARHVRFVLAAVAVSGVLALTYEVVWIRLLALVLGSSTYSFSLMLAAFIAGIALGSYLVYRRISDRHNSLVLFGLAQAGVALSIGLTLPFYERLPYWFAQLSGAIVHAPSMYAPYEAMKLVMCFLLMLAPTTFLGMTLPLASRVATRAVAEVGASVGRVFALNTLGNVAGALAATFWLLPALGLKTTLQSGLLLNVALAVGAFVLVGGQGLGRRLGLSGAVAALAAGVALLPPWSPDVLASGPFRHAQLADDFEAYKAALNQKAETLFYKDGPDSTVAVQRQGAMMRLTVNGKADASVSLEAGANSDMATQVLLGHLPFLSVPEARDVFVIGFGSGVTAGAVLTHPDTRVDLAEISQEVLQAAPHFAPFNHDVLNNPRLTVYRDDAMTQLQIQPRRYDVIVTEPSNPWMARVGNLFSIEAYRAMDARLKPGGAVVQWLQAYELDNATFALALRTFRAAFPHVTIWQTQGGDMVLVGTREPQRYRPEALAAFGPAPRADLARIGIRELSTLLMLQVATSETSAEIAGVGPLNTVRFPRIETQAPRALFLGARVTRPYERDDRLRPRAPQSEPLLIDTYMQGRKFRLSPAEWADLHDKFVGTFSPVGGDKVAALVLESWLREHPNDQTARLRAALEPRSLDRLDAGLARVRAMRAERPADGKLAEKEGDILFARLSETSWRLDPARDWAERALAHHRKSSGAGVNVVLASIHLETGNYDAYFQAVDKALTGPAALPEADRMPVLLAAADIALMCKVPDRAVGYLKQANALTPEDANVRKLTERLLSTHAGTR